MRILSCHRNRYAPGAEVDPRHQVADLTGVVSEVVGISLSHRTKLAVAKTLHAPVRKHPAVGRESGCDIRDLRGRLSGVARVTVRCIEGRIGFRRVLCQRRILSDVFLWRSVALLCRVGLLHESALHQSERQRCARQQGSDRSEVSCRGRWSQSHARMLAHVREERYPRTSLSLAEIRFNRTRDADPNATQRNDFI